MKQKNALIIKDTRPSTAITKYTDEIHPIVAKASTLTITDQSSMAEATTLLSTLNKINDRITEEKEKVTIPLKEALKAENARFAPFEALYKDAISSIRIKMTRYQTEALSLTQTAASSLLARIKPGKGNLTIQTATQKLADLPTPASTVSTDAGTIKFRTVTKFTVPDHTKLPLTYLMPDEAKIKQALKENVRILGVNYYEEQVPVNYR